jgi:hypothetical protein
MKLQVCPILLFRSPLTRFADVSDTAYRISIALDVDNKTDEEVEAPVLLLNVQYPEAYPDVGPHLDLTAPPNASKHAFLDVAEDKARLLESLEPTIEESLGMAMVFTLVTVLKESAEQLIAERQKAVENEREEEQKQAEAEENRKFEGTKVTAETFLAWRDKFRKEQEAAERQRREEEEAEEKKKGRGRVEEKKLTGRQLWERGLAKGEEGEGEIDPDEADALDGIDKLKVGT